MGETQTYRVRNGVPMSTETWICTGTPSGHVPNSDDTAEEGSLSLSVHRSDLSATFP